MRRLTDTGGYTGTHKHRFDKSGKGRGLAGRDSIAKRSSRVDSNGVADYYLHPVYQRDNVHDLSLITRPGRSKAQPRSNVSRAKNSSGSPRRKPRSRNAPESKGHADANAVGQVERPSIFSKLTDEGSFTGTHRNRPISSRHSLPEESDDDASQSDASWSNFHASVSDSDRLEPRQWDATSISSGSVNGSTAPTRGRYRHQMETDAGSRGEAGSPTSPRAAARAEKAAYRRALHEKKKAERRFTREEADATVDHTGLSYEIDLDTTEAYGDDCVDLLVLVRHQQAGMAALTQAILLGIEDQQSKVSEQTLFDVKTDYTKKQKSVCMRIGAEGIEFLDSRATMNSLAVLPFSSLSTWTLTKPGRVALALLGSEKPVTIVSRQAPAIIEELTQWSPVPPGADSDVLASAKTKQAAAGATITFSRRFGSEFLAEDAAQSSPLFEQRK